MEFLTVPCFSSNMEASARAICNSSANIFWPLATNLLFDNCMSTILLPFIFPKRIMVAVEIIFNTNFCAVPAFIRELPVTNSGPTTTSTGN